MSKKTTEVLDAETVEEPSQELAAAKPSKELATLADDFLPVMTLDQAKGRRDTITELVSKMMKEGVDYGTIPGTPKPSLWQPGADKLCNIFGLSPTFEELVVVEDWDGSEHDGEPFFYYKVKCRLWRGERLMAEGIASCNSWEEKYRWRQQEIACPHCGKEAVIKGKKEYGGGWLCWGKKGGCGAKFPDDATEITDQAGGRKPNPAIFDQVNTIQKISQKRAKIGATVNCTSASEFFTQDLEDIAGFSHDIDTGGHSRETQAGRPTDSAKPNPPAEPRGEGGASRSPSPAGDTNGYDERFVELLQKLKKREDWEEAFTKAYRDMVELMGTDAKFIEITERFGMKHAKDLAGKKRGDLKACLYQLWSFCLSMMEEEQEDQQGQPELSGLEDVPF